MFEDTWVSIAQNVETVEADTVRTQLTFATWNARGQPVHIVATLAAFSRTSRNTYRTTFTHRGFTSW